MDKKEYIQSKIRDIKDFPKEGIIFGCERGGVRY